MLVNNPFLKTLLRFFAYFSYVSILGYLAFRFDASHELLISKFLEHGYHVFILNWIVLFTYPILLGILFALPSFISTLGKRGSMQFDWVMFLGLGLPLIYWIVNPFLFWASANYPWITNLLIKWQPPSLVIGVVFGFVLITAFKNRSPE